MSPFWGFIDMDIRFSRIGIRVMKIPGKAVPSGKNRLQDKFI